MGLIKRYQIEEKGEILIKKKPVMVFPEPSDLDQKPFEGSYESLAQDDNQILSQAEEQAREIIAMAREDADSIRSKAHDEGLALSQKESDSKIKEALDTLNQAVVERKKIIKDAEAEILRLSIKAAEQIIRSEVSLHRDVCLNIVSEAINRVSDREQVIVKVNKEDAEYIKKYKDRLSGILDGIKSFSVLEDSSIEPGGCVIETNLGYVDARISTKIAAIEEALKKVSSGSGEES